MREKVRATFGVPRDKFQGTSSTWRVVSVRGIGLRALCGAIVPGGGFCDTLYTLQVYNYTLLTLNFAL